VGATIGIRLAVPGNTTTTALFQTADQAMYKAKSLGGDCYRFVEPPLQ
jgi:GGDEF domain-containing protein